MRTLHVLCIVVTIVCLGCNGTGRTEGGLKKVSPESTQKAPEPNKPAVIEVKPKNDIAPALPCKEKGRIDLSPFPQSKGGVPILDSSGEVTYCLESSGSFKAIVTLKGLKKAHKYILTLNGKVGRPGNQELIKAGRSDNGEGVVDREILGTTNPDGYWNGEFPHVRLDPNDYDVKFFVKDASDAGQRCVLYNDYLSFTITK